MTDTEAIIEALATRWYSTSAVVDAFPPNPALTGLIANIFSPTAPEGTNRPYLIIAEIGEAPRHYTNRSKYNEGNFTLSVAHTFKEEAYGLLAIAEAYTENAPLGDLGNGSKVKFIRTGNITHREAEAAYHIVTQEYHWRTGRAPRFTPA